MHKFDILIAGTGPAGLASAIVLSQAGCSVLLVDKGEPNDFRAGEHLKPMAKGCLNKLGFQEKELLGNHYSFAGLQIFWGSEQAKYQDALFRMGGAGWILDRCRFNEQLRAKAEALGCQFLYGNSLQKISSKPDGFTTTLRNKKGKCFIHSSFLVDATGRVAKGARLLGAKVKIDDRLIGTCILQSSDRVDLDPHSKWGHLESCPQGWWFSTATPGGKRASYWMSDVNLLTAPFSDGLEALLTSAPQTKTLLERSGTISEIFQRPAHSQCLDSCSGPRWVAVGDAASSFDPMALEGIAKALKTGIAGGEAILAATSGDHSLLVAYDRDRKEEYEKYRSLKVAHYGMEQRWSSEPFWSKRHTRST